MHSAAQVYSAIAAAHREMEDPDLTDAGGGYVTAMPGAASIDSAMSFGLSMKPSRLTMMAVEELQETQSGQAAATEAALMQSNAKLNAAITGSRRIREPFDSPGPAMIEAQISRPDSRPSRLNYRRDGGRCASDTKVAELIDREFRKAALSGRPSQSPLDHHLLDVDDRLRRVEPFGAGLGAVHDRVAAVEAERVLEIVEALALRFVARVDEPAIGLQ